ncbi:MAG TPA: RNA polymerase sigma factor [Polyangiaceae bacterium]|nr:RNA polymerase sigma factor [Polyangiaceae bacterium]
MRAIRRGASDVDLIAAIAAGDRSALGGLFDRYEPELRRYFGRLGVGASDADDLVQATFLEIARAAARFDASAPARGWVYGIATTMVRRHRRSVARFAAKLFAWGQVARVAAAPPPDENAELERTVQKLSAALGRMAPKKREVFVLVALEGLSGDEVAKALDVPINTVWTRLHHARRELRAELEGGER